MKVAYILEKFPSPTEHFVLNEILEFESQGVELVLFVLKRQKKHENILEINELKATIHYLPRFHFYIPIIPILFAPLSLLRFSNMTKQRKRITLTKVLQLLRMFRYHSISQYFARKNNQLDHIHAHFAFITADIACYLSKIMKVNYSFTAHAQDIYLNLDNLPLKIKQASFIITCTKYNKEVLNKLTDNRYKEKIFHVYHGFNIKKWLNIDKKQQNNDEKINILSVARLVEKKGLIYLLKAVKILKERGEKFNCIIIGEGPLKKKLQRFIIENKLQDNVKIKPFFRQEKLKQYYINADVFILPCILAKNGDRDGLPNVILEAMASGTPVIATNVSAIGELIKNNENGVLIPPGDSILLADAFQYLKSDSDFYNKIADKGVDTIHNFFSIEKSTIELMKIFEAHKYTLPSKKINNF